MDNTNIAKSFKPQETLNPKIWKKVKKLIFRIDDSCNNMY